MSPIKYNIDKDMSSFVSISLFMMNMTCMNITLQTHKFHEIHSFIRFTDDDDDASLWISKKWLKGNWESILNVGKEK